MTKPIPKLGSDVLKNYKACLKETAVYGDQLEARIDYILRKIYEVFGEEFAYWHFHDAQEGGVGSLHRAFYDDSVAYFVVNPSPSSDLLIHLDDGKILYGLIEEFPLRWLTEDFEEELIAGKASYEQWEANEKAEKAAKRAAKKAEKERLKAAAAAKLTKEEKKALGLK